MMLWEDIFLLLNFLLLIYVTIVVRSKKKDDKNVKDEHENEAI